MLVIIFGGVYALLNVQDIADYFRLRGYQPSAKVKTLADDTTMKEATRRVFYVSHPKLDQKQAFNENCKTSEQSIVLGCYGSSRGIYSSGKIYLLDVDQPKLAGVVEVTAAHEVLHAQYERLSSPEQARVDRMTSDFFKTLKDERIRETMANYEKSDPGSVPNELHSILATEVPKLSGELENYYSGYFKNRQKIVSYSEDYEQAFVELENRSDAIKKQLDGLRVQIDSNRSRIDELSSELKQKKARLDALLAADQTEEYNRSVSGFNELVSDYNSLVNQTRQIINQFNDLVKKFNDISIQRDELNQAIDSNSLKSGL